MDRCLSQYHGHGCGRPAGHPDAHYSADRMSGWTTRVESARGPWSQCETAHPTAGLRCFCVSGHEGPHYALIGPAPEGEWTGCRVSPFVEW